MWPEIEMGGIDNMPCSSYKYMHDEYEICYRKPNDECPHGYDSCYCQGDKSCCSLSEFDKEEEEY